MNEKLEKTIKHLNYFKQNIPIVLTEFHDVKPNDYIQWFVLVMFQRLLDSTVSIRNLLQEDKTIYDFGIGILIRPILLDALIGLNLLSLLKNCLSENLKMEEIHKKIDNFCLSVLADGIIQTLKYFKELNSLDFIETEKLNETYNNSSEKYSDFIEQPDGTNTIPKERIKLDTRAIKQFQTLAKDDDMKDIGRRLHDLYALYSKYDHFGFLFYEVSNSEKIEKDKRVIASISLFVNHYANLCDILQRTTPENLVINEIYSSAKEYLANKHH